MDRGLRPLFGAGLGRVSGRVRLFLGPRPQARRHGLRPVFRSAPPTAASSRSTWRGNFMARPRVLSRQRRNVAARADDEAYFERFYTKLVRHVTQGRLLRGSHRGVCWSSEIAICWAERSTCGPNSAIRG